MKNYATLLVSFVWIFMLAGCSLVNNVNNETFYDVLTPVKGEKGSFRTERHISKKDDVKIVQSILHQAKWVNAKVQMNPLQADFMMYTNINSTHASEKADSYYLWKQPDKDVLEIMFTDQSKYVQLPKKESKILYHLLSGKDLE
ncbi:hypothetical protein [Peribacillus deserti]|uniref:YhfM-like domain-containing protein n=1 Tax=Peribacillus deserti TaxID=673318 RepID=A0A2N5M1K2_9BACI|nr:hypothetical protein [Peribacillus deserti]PLT28185.1 hypothetical protein CUU66_19780 [Peribacillus deserti]